MTRKEKHGVRNSTKSPQTPPVVLWGVVAVMVAGGELTVLLHLIWE